MAPRVFVGIDLIEIERVARRSPGIRSASARASTRSREIAECDRKKRPDESYAGRFAAKEAIGKLLGTGVPWTWREIEIAGRGKPEVTLSGRMARAAERLGVERIDLSMTHSRTTAAAVAVAVAAD